MATLGDKPLEFFLELHLWVRDVDIEERSLVLCLHQAWETVNQQ